MDRDPLERWAREAANTMNGMGRRLSAIEEYLQKKSREEAMQMASPNEQAQQLIAGIRQHHDNYSTIITLIGYGGVFALWSATAKSMQPIWVGIAGVLIAVSLLIFVVFEMGKMLWTTGVLAKAQQLDEHGHRRSPVGQIEFMQEETVRFNRKWHNLAFWSSTVPGFAGGLIVLVHYVILVVQEAVQAAS